MSSPLPFALYRKTAPALADPVGATLDIALRDPIESGGVRLFRSSLWLPLPDACRAADALSLEGSTLKALFRPAEFSLQTADARWFSRAEDSDGQRTRLELTWPASIVRIDPAQPGRRDAFGLHRADGEAVSEEAAQRGRSGDRLEPPWVGTPTVVVFDEPAPTVGQKGLTQNLRSLPARAGGTPTGGGVGEAMIVGTISIVGNYVAMLQGSQRVPGVRIAARPTSPRLRLVLEGGAEDGSDRLLWQALAPGEHLQPVNLPADTLASEWTPALEQVLAFCKRVPHTDPLPRLRLDIESDGPCLVSLSEVALALAADHTLIGAPVRLDFDGRQHERRSVALDPAPPGSRRLLLLEGRLRAAAVPPAEAPPATGGAGARSGLLLTADQRASGAYRLDAPASIAGFRFDWHPLSEQIAGVLRVLPEGARRGTPALIEQAFSFDTAHPSGTASEPLRLAVRWPAHDLQAQALRVELVLREGRGIWLAGAAGGGARLHQASADLVGRSIDLAPAGDWLRVPPAGDASAAAEPHEPAFSLGPQALAYASRTQDRFAVRLTPPLLDAWPGQALTISSGVAAEVVIERATLRTAIG